jgi:ATP-dependent DNA helicase RecG
MPTKTTIELTTDLAQIEGIAPARAKMLREIGLRCVADLIIHLPNRYEEEAEESSIAQAGNVVGPNHGSKAPATVRGTLTSKKEVRRKQHHIEVLLEDGTATIQLIWFNSPWLMPRLHPGMNIRAWGNAVRHGDALQMVNARWEEIPEDGAVEIREPIIRPIYPASENVKSPMIEQAVRVVLEPALALLDDHLTDDYRKERALPTLADSYRMMHAPRDADEPKHARRRLAFDELLQLQLAVMMKRRQRRDTLHAPVLKHTEEIDRRILARFPFTLTNAQRVVVDEIAGELAHRVPMNRLVQGDVGSGKTVVALYAMLMAVASKHQAALMAPTELLAEQHFSSITAMLTDSRVNIALLTGSLKPAQRRSLLTRLETGKIDILIGTHALLTKNVKFRSLAVVVVDEQHRFGVHQRASIRAKTSDKNSAPHTLVMTATPIPRTLSLTLFGDLDISTIREMPPGRKPIITKVVSSEKTNDVYKHVRDRMKKGEQAYIVVPVVEESDAGLKDVSTHLKILADGFLKGLKLAPMHGRLSREERDSIMQQFREHTLDAIVATTVIEVGVDVPNASIMVIEHADRFGLAQLHQLRGRIGRGTRRSLCVLIADPTTEQAEARLSAIASTTDGFQIAEKDLEIRGPGELFGTRQSGIAPFRVAELPHDLELLAMARRDAKEWVERDPTLFRKDNALLRRRVLKTYGEAFGLGDVA